MSDPAPSNLITATKLPPILRMPTELVREIFKAFAKQDREAWLALSSCCRGLREIGLPLIFASYFYIIGGPTDFGRLRSLAASSLRLHVRTLEVVDEDESTPLDLELVELILDRFPNLTSIQCELNAKSFFRIHETPRIRRLWEGSQKFAGIWSDVLESGAVLRRDEPLLRDDARDRIPVTVGHPLQPYSGGMDRFFLSTLSTNVHFPHIDVQMDATVPIPPSSFLSTTRLPFLERLSMTTTGQPTAEFLESIGVVAVAQSSARRFELTFVNRHPLRLSFGLLGRISPFEELAGVTGWDMIGSGVGTMAFDATKWTVTNLHLYLGEIEVPPPFLRSLGNTLRSLTALELLPPYDSRDMRWPSDWNTVVEAFTHFPSLSSLLLPSSLTPYRTFENFIACSDDSFASLAHSHPLLHRQTIEAGGWWRVWKRLGVLLNLSRLRRLGRSLPQGCRLFFDAKLGVWEGVVIEVEGSGGTTAMVGEMFDTERDTATRERMAEDCGAEVIGAEEESAWRCVACGGMGLEMDLFEAARSCGDEEVERALNDEWKTTWTEDDVKAELALERAST